LVFYGQRIGWRYGFRDGNEVGVFLDVATLFGFTDCEAKSVQPDVSRASADALKAIEARETYKSRSQLPSLSITVECA